MADNLSFRTGLPMVDLFFNGFNMMLDAQRNAFGAGFAAPTSFGRTRYDREVGASEEQVIPVFREELRVGKRQVQSAKAYRVSTTVVEVPVEQQVNLRAETVVIERRPATGTTVRGGQTFQDKTVEVHELYEEPVVGKVVTQAEEVVIYKTISERAATVRERLRETHVNVEERNANNLPQPIGEVEIEQEFRAAAGNKPRELAVVKPQADRKEHGDNREPQKAEPQHGRRQD